MDEIKIDAATLEEAGAAIGFMFAALLRGFKDGMDAYDVMEAANDIKEVHETEEPLKRDPVKTEIGDCRKCWRTRWIWSNRIHSQGYHSKLCAS